MLFHTDRWFPNVWGLFILWTLNFRGDYYLFDLKNWVWFGIICSIFFLRVKSFILLGFFFLFKRYGWLNYGLCFRSLTRKLRILIVFLALENRFNYLRVAIIILSFRSTSSNQAMSTGSILIISIVTSPNWFVSFWRLAYILSRPL